VGFVEQMRREFARTSNAGVSETVYTFI
jgi:hypothetical protein